MDLRINVTDENGDSLLHTTIYQDGSDAAGVEKIKAFVHANFKVDDQSTTTVQSAFEEATELYGGGMRAERSRLPIVMGRRISMQELADAFDGVKHPTYWKYPINARVRIKNEEGRRIIEEAIIWYTGSVPTFADQDDGTTMVLASGYYIAIGA